MTLVLLIGAGGGLGAVARFLLDDLLNRLFRHRTTLLPWATLLINITGSFALGAVTAASTAGSLSDDARLVLGVGVCGGYTTFSTAMVETLRIGRRPGPAPRVWALVYWVVTPLLTAAAAAAGWFLV